jgi:hypothetical protein
LNEFQAPAIDGLAEKPRQRGEDEASIIEIEEASK